MCATEHIFTCPYIICRLLSVKFPAIASFISVIVCKKREFYMESKQHFMMSLENVDQASVCLCFPQGVHALLCSSYFGK